MVKLTCLGSVSQWEHEQVSRHNAIGYDFITATYLYEDPEAIIVRIVFS